MILVYSVLVKLWSYLSTHGDDIILYCYLWLAHKPEFEVVVLLVILLILLQHAKCTASFIGIGSYVLTYGHDCTGTHHGMQLHTLLGV